MRVRVLAKTKTVSLTINDQKIRALDGEKILWAALDNGIYIPNLCAIREKSEPFAACRLCFVEIEGEDRPVTACTAPVGEGMVVNTKGAKALRLARTALELLLASHPVDCAHCLKKWLLRTSEDSQASPREAQDKKVQEDPA